MQTVKLSLSLPDATHPNMQVQVSSEDADCNVVIELPVRTRESLARAPDTPLSAQDEYVLGGYAGI
jgi:hypothetical protein